MTNKRKKVGLALGSGSMRGIAHVGIIKVLEENQIPIDFISGSSIGALVGGIYAANKDIKQLEKLVLETDLKKTLALIDPTWKGGLLRGEKIKDLLNQYINHKQFKDLKIPMAIVATNFKTGEPEIITDGDLSLAIRASISIPLFFQPVKREKELLVDGGMTIPVPIKPLRKMGADIVIAVNLYNYPRRSEYLKKINKTTISNESIKILLYQLSKRDMIEADVSIVPDVNKYGLTDLIKYRQKIVKIGEEATHQQLNLIKKLIK
jgi:NTE family protein